MTSVMMVQPPGADIHDVSEVGLLRATASDIEAVLEMLGRCSRISLLHRFHGFSDGVHYFRTLLRDGPIDQTLLAWRRRTCVGVATLGTGEMGRVDLAVLVEDAWQRRGIGTWLVRSLLVNARAKGVTTVHADVLGDDSFILEALRRIGPLTVAIEFGSYSIDVEIGNQGDHPAIRLPVGNPHSDAKQVKQSAHERGASK